jgi:xylulokinase
MVLAIDVGTSVLKAAVFRKDGSSVSRAEAPIVLRPNPDPLRHEVDALEWLRGLKAVTGRLGLAGAQALEAVVISGNGPTLVPVSADGNPLSNAMTWMDRRGAEEASIVSAKRGRPTDPAFTLPKALWIFRHDQGLYQRTRYFFSCPEFVTFVLTGAAFTFLPTPQYTETIMWDSEAVELLGMDAELFPAFIAPGAGVGKVTPAGAAATGVPAGSPVIAGAPDFIASLLGTATVKPGRACVRSGTSEGINLCSRAPTADRRLLSVAHLAEGLYNVSGVISTTGKALEWFRQMAGRSSATYESLFESASRVPAGSNRLIFLPYLSGERAPLWDARARACFIGLTLNHGLDDMARAVIESVAFAIRDVIEVMEENGQSVQDLRIIGTPSRSAFWNQVKADVTARRILVPAQQDADLVGDLCLALFGLGEFASIAEASESVVRMGAGFEPNPAEKGLYDEMFALYRDSYKGLKEVFARLSTPRSSP